MKQTLYVRVGKHPRGGRSKVMSGSKVSHHPVTDSQGNPMPTVSFALEVEVPDELFTQAQKVVASIDVTAQDVTVPISIAMPT